MHDPRKTRLIFMGTPEFAVPSLSKLVAAGYDIVAVVTAPDKAAGRGMQLQQSAVKKYAEEKGLFLLQPEKLKNADFLDTLKRLNADLQIVVAFRMLPEIVWNMPPKGTINVHASLLPQYRGAAPINWVIINGEKQTGITTFKLKQEIDTGDILLSKEIVVGDDETAGELHDRLKGVGADLLLATVDGVMNGTITEVPQKFTPQQSASQATLPTLRTAPKIFTETCRIDWHCTMNNIYNLIRGLSPYPAAFTILENKKLKIYKAEKIFETPVISPGQFRTDRKTFLQFACSDGYISLLEIQLEGKKRMPVVDFLRGYHFEKDPGA